ncbi:general substrate transporter [Zychaea mexicana]|uniref:general substrate transporter n=1 Tax=Zychaea mexicana TaxID=64656 RepID=UPI0022FEB5EC|nr:general substrate transporter [Zychaea mexicana]KAI9491632.1 general substrate transporter [Zychaea mexicana]
MAQFPWRIYGVCFFAAFGGLCFGYDTGVLSSILTMEDFIYTMKQRDYLTPLEQGTLTGLLLAGCFCGALVAGQTADLISRKRTIILASLVFMLGAALQTGANGYAMMVTGRAIAGLGIGGLSMTVPLYQSELAPKQIRGRLISLQQFMITVGLMIAFWAGAGTNIHQTGQASWRIPLAIQIAPALILFFGAFFLPYSPRWLISKGRNEEALEVLAKLHANGDANAPFVQQEYHEIIEQVSHERAVSVTNYFELFKGTLRRRLILGILIQVFQQFTGINSIMYYAPQIFKQAGIGEQSATLIASGVNGVLNMFATVPAIMFMDKLGRRKTLMSGAIFMGVSMLLCGIVMGATGRVYYDAAEDKNNVDMSGNTSASYFCIVMIYFFVAGFAYSWGPVGWIYPAEIYTLNIRAKATSLSTAANWLMNFVISEIVPVMLASITWGTYIFFGCCCFVMCCCVFFFFPETKGRSLEEMDAVFSGSIIAFRSKPALPHTEELDAEKVGSINSGKE